MLKLLNFLITGCWHKWEIIETYERETWSFFQKKYVGSGKVRDVQCTRCGHIKRIEA